MKLIVIGNGMVGQRLLERLQASASANSRSRCCARNRVRPTIGCI